VIDPDGVPISRVQWQDARRIIRSLFPPIDLFEDIADPEDWPLLIAAEQKTNPRLMERLGALDLVPPNRRVSGPGATYLMAPFTHVSTDRPSRFSDGSYGVLYLAERFETALLVMDLAQKVSRLAVGSVNIKPGVEDNGMTAVQGINPNDVVANSSFERLQDKSQVKISNTPVSAANTSETNAP